MQKYFIFFKELVWFVNISENALLINKARFGEMIKVNKNWQEFSG